MAVDGWAWTEYGRWSGEMVTPGGATEELDASPDDSQMVRLADSGTGLGLWASAGSILTN